VPDIPMLAEGGIVTSATLAMIGESGPEAVIPLDRAGSMGFGGGGGNTINITVQGADPNEVVRALQAYNRNVGKVPVSVQ
jgi:phosphotransferase system HPr-like phosphotransfer protein